MMFRSSRLTALLCCAGAIFVSACAHFGGAGVHGRCGHGIIVVGVGDASGKPDLARVEVGVMVRAANVREATDQLNSRIANVVDALKRAGVSDADLMTQSLNVYQERTYGESEPSQTTEMPSDPSQPRTTQQLPVTHYVAQNTLEVKVRDLKQLSRFLGTIMDAGANQIQNLRLEISDPTPLAAMAREKAIANARQQAEQYAALAGKKLGEVVAMRAIAQDEWPRPISFGFDGGAMMRQEAAQSMPVETGQLEIRRSVEVHFKLVDD